MEKKPQRSGLRPLAHVGIGLLIWIVTMSVATRTLHERPASAAIRIAMVVLGVGGFLPWLIAVARLIMSQDEFSQRLHLIAIALTCALTGVLVLAGDYLQTAGLLGEISLQSIWIGMVVLWWLSVLAATWYYR